MTATLGLRCACGSFEATVTGIEPSRGNRVICYCDDCQAFARFLDAGAGLLDAHGGTDIYQTSQANVRIADGTRLACLRLTAKGLLRWYAGCCRTPVANMLAIRGIPVVGLPVTSLDFTGAGLERDAILGPVRARVNGRFAVGGGNTVGAHPRAGGGYWLRVGRIILAARLRRDHLRSPFFDSATGMPVATPLVLDDETLRQLKDAARPG